MAMTTAAQRILQGHAMSAPGQLPPEFWDLIERYRSDLVNQAFALLGNVQDAEDVAQETFCDAYARSQELASVQSLGPWLRTINKANALDRLRSRLREKGKSERRQRDLPVRNATTGGFSMLEIRESVAKSIEQLPEELRDVIVLRYWEQLTYEEIATRLGQPNITVRRRLVEAYVWLYQHTNLKLHMRAPGVTEGHEPEAPREIRADDPSGPGSRGR